MPTHTVLWMRGFYMTFSKWKVEYTMWWIMDEPAYMQWWSRIFVHLNNKSLVTLIVWINTNTGKVELNYTYEVVDKLYKSHKYISCIVIPVWIVDIIYGHFSFSKLLTVCLPILNWSDNYLQLSTNWTLWSTPLLLNSQYLIWSCSALSNKASKTSDQYEPDIKYVVLDSR